MDKHTRRRFPTERENRFQKSRTRLFDRMRELGTITDNYRPTFLDLTRELVWDARKKLQIWERKFKDYSSEEAAPLYHLTSGFHLELDQAEQEIKRLIKESEHTESDGVPALPDSQTTLF